MLIEPLLKLREHLFYLFKKIIIYTTSRDDWCDALGLYTQYEYAFKLKGHIPGKLRKAFSCIPNISGSSIKGRFSM